MNIKFSMKRDEVVKVLAYLRSLQDTYETYAKADVAKSPVFEARYIEIEQLKLKMAKQIAKADEKVKV